MSEKKIKGNTIVPGIGLGKAFFVGRIPGAIKEKKVLQSEVANQIHLFSQIREKAKKIYSGYMERYNNPVTHKKKSNVVEIYEMILDDPFFVNSVVDSVSSNLYSLETAIKVVSNDFINRFNATQNSYFKDRSVDVIEICELLLSLISGNRIEKELAEPVIIIVPKVFIPSDILSYDPKMIKGIVTLNAGPTSHAAIIARTNKIPLISGVKGIVRYIKPNDEILLDGYNNYILIHPKPSNIHPYKEQDDINDKLHAFSLKWKRAVYTKDGICIKVNANVALPEDVDYANKFAADGIGLVRSEFLYFQYKRMPTFSEQVDYFCQIFKKSGRQPITIRLLDIGGDKIPSFMKIPKEFNPFMGWRGIRILLKKEKLFKEHLSAIMTAADERPYSILVPMVSTVKEWKDAKKFIIHTATELNKPVPKIGALFEVPLALFEIKRFIDDMDFASIGTNDLIQYLLAADRNNPNVNYLHNPVDSAFLTILKTAISTARDRGIPISICGEIAGYPLYTILLLGIGLKQFSLAPGTIPLIKEIISRVDVSVLTENINHLLVDDLHSDPLQYLIHLNKSLLGDIVKDFSSYFEPWGNSN